VFSGNKFTYIAYNIISFHTVLRENFEGENFCQFVTVFWLFVKVFSVKFEGVASLAWQSVKVFSVKIVLFTNSQKFSPSKVSHYALVEL